MNVEKMLKDIKTADPGRYSIQVREMKAIEGAYRGDTYGTMIAAYEYGFLRGQRAAEADRGKRRFRVVRLSVSVDRSEHRR